MLDPIFSGHDLLQSSVPERDQHPRRLWPGLVLGLVLALAAGTRLPAQEEATGAVRQSGLETAIGRLRALVLELEEADVVPSPEDLARLDSAVADVRLATDEARRISERDGTDPPGKTQSARRWVNRAAALELLPVVEELRPRLEAAEQREGLPTPEESQRGKRIVEELTRRVEEIEGWLADVGDDSRPKGVREARALLRRAVAVDLTRQALELRGLVEKMEAVEVPPTAEEIDELRKKMRALQASLLEFEAQGDAGDASKDEVRQAEQAVVLSQTVSRERRSRRASLGHAGS
jgi:hypothetical protein